jgi:hypothetical protein
MFKKQKKYYFFLFFPHMENGGGQNTGLDFVGREAFSSPHVLTLTCKAYVRGVKSFVDDLNEPGIVRCGVALLPPQFEKNYANQSLLETVLSE